MKVFKQIAKISFQDALSYKGRVVIWFMVGMVTPLLYALVWTSSMQTNQTIDNYTKIDFITYYVLILISSQFFRPHIVDEVSYKIQKGGLNNFMIKPITLFKYTFIHESVWKIVESLIALPVFVIVLFLLRNSFSIAQSNSYLILYAVIALLIGYLMNFLIEFTIGTTAFWVFETGSIKRITEFLASMGSGRYFPLNFLPGILQTFFKVLPFKYTIFFPVNILMNKISTKEILTQGTIQILYLAGIFLILKMIWKQGLKKYNAIGI